MKKSESIFESKKIFFIPIKIFKIDSFSNLNFHFLITLFNAKKGVQLDEIPMQTTQPYYSNQSYDNFDEGVIADNNSDDNASNNMSVRF